MRWADSSIKVIIALDFGTSRSGYAYAFRDNEEIIYHKEWLVGDGSYPKTMTCLLFSPDDKPISWGFKALEEYSSLPRHEKDKGYYFVDRFKMQIPNKDGKYREENEKKNEPAYKTPKNRQELEVFNLVVTYLKFLKDDALKQVRGSTAQTLKDQDIRWVLTVPSIWTDLEKKFMRRAAEEANIINSSDDNYNRLLLALEPEAAAFYCHHQGELLNVKSDTVMIVDCGGGTVDIVTYNIDRSGKMRGINGVPTTGGAHGSTYVDKKFIELLGQKLSPRALNKLRQENGLAMLQLKKTWETIKCGIDNLNSNQTKYIPLTLALHNILQEYCNQEWNELAKKQKDDLNIHLSFSEINSFFKPTLEGLVKEINEQFNYLNKRQCDVMFVVGGYSKAKLLQEEVRKKFEDSKKTIVRFPSNPELAVLYGAVYFGQNPDAWAQRISRRTYGCNSTEMPFDGKKHNISKKLYSSSYKQHYCDDIFHVFVKAGDPVLSKQPKTFTFFPLEADQKSIEFSFYSTENKNPKYVDDSDVIRYDITEVITRTDISNGLNWQIEVSIYFGGTEIDIVIKDLNSKVIKRAKIDFRSRYL